MATELGKAYVQIVPSSKGISGKIQGIIEPESEKAGKSGGRKIGSSIVKMIGAAGIGAAIGKSISEGAKLEQSLGGIETLFKENADMVKKHADDAFRTTGQSANEYMENVTGFSASLLQSLGGDTEAAAKISNRAMIDMADNSNKMGTNMQDIQNAYQGFAKQNYTMLDNLKLGYGGTKKEMERLLTDATKLTGVKYNIDNLADVYTAVGVIQDQLGITGTTALEAEQTISGSLNAMKSSFTNVLGKLALGEDIKPALKDLAKTLSTFVFGNLLPMLGNIFSALPTVLITFISEAIPILIAQGGEMINSLSTGIVESFPQLMIDIQLMLNSMILWIQESLPEFLNKGVELITGFATGLLSSLPIVMSNIGEILDKLLNAVFDLAPQLLDSGFELIKNLATGLKDNFPAIVESITEVINKLLGTIVERYPDYLKKGLEIIGQLAKGLWDNLPYIIKTITDLLTNLIKTISSHLPEFIKKGMQLIVELGVGLIKAVPSVLAKIPQIIGSILGAFGSIVASFFNIGADIIKGLWNGIVSVKDWIMGKISGFVDGILGGVKKFFGIKSPSRVMANEVGKYLPSGLAVGIEANTKPLLNTMEDLSVDTVNAFDYDAAIGKMSTNDLSSSNSKIDSMLNMLETLLNNPAQYQVVMDTGVLAGELTPAINKNLANEEIKGRRGM